MNEKRWKALLKISGMIIAVSLFFMSVMFSIAGFNFNAPGWEWLGIFMALAITVFELILTDEEAQKNHTLVFLGVLAYIYGVITNVYGLWIAQGQPDYKANPVALLFPLVLGLLLEIAPEPLLMWSLGLSLRGARDILGMLIGQATEDNSNRHSNDNRHFNENRNDEQGMAERKRREWEDRQRNMNRDQKPQGMVEQIVENVSNRKKNKRGDFRGRPSKNQEKDNRVFNKDIESK